MEGPIQYCTKYKKDGINERIPYHSVDQWILPETFHHYEITITFNPKLWCSHKEMEKHIPVMIREIIVKADTYTKDNLDAHAYLEGVKEFQENGAPHFHGTLLIKKKMSSAQHHNFEQYFQRQYGKTSMWYTGFVDKHHKNDHFDGLWSQYLLKDNPETYFKVKIYNHRVPSD